MKYDFSNINAFGYNYLIIEDQILYVYKFIILLFTEKWIINPFLMNNLNRINR